MIRYVLDTDHVSALLEGNTIIHAKTQQHLGEIAVSIVTVQEVFNGWIGRINHPAQAHNLAPLYTKLWNAIEYFKAVPIVNFDDEMQRQYQDLLAANPPLRKNRLQKDIRIATVALSLNAIVVTRNQKDFGLVPGLAIVDWSV